MFDISIKINGNTISKRDATVKDYINLLDYNEKNKDKTFLTSKNTFFDCVELIISWFGEDKVTKDELASQLTLKEIFDTYKKIENNVAEVFFGKPLKTAIEDMRKILKQENK